MLFCDKAAAETTTSATIADAGNIRLGGGYRPAAPTATGTTSAETSPTDTTTSATTADAGKIRLGGGYRPAANTADTGKIRLGGGYRPAFKDV